MASAPDEEDSVVSHSNVGPMAAAIRTARTGDVIELASDGGSCLRIAASGRRREILCVAGRTEV